MGNILTCHQFSRDKSEPSNPAKKTPTTASISATNPQPFSSEVQDGQRGRRGERLASVTSPSTAAEGIADESREVTKNVGVSAPVPVPIAASVSNSHIKYHTGGRVKEEVQESEMASDEDYMAFLDKANRDPNEGHVKGERIGEKMELKATDQGASVPQVLKKATEEAFYVSDADEPFVPVCLKHSGKGLPNEVAFAKLVSHPSPDEAEIEIMDVAEWDTQGQYKELVDAVREAAKGSDVRVYRISRGSSRVEYWIVGLEGGQLVGVKALAIES